MTAFLFDDTRCELGEGAFWHPEREQLFWFDITGKRLLTREGRGTRVTELPEMTSAAGWLDRDTLFVASETGFFRLDIATGRQERLADLERENPMTRSNDGRADPEGGFWIGTMGKDEGARAGAIYRYYRGEVRRLYDGITVPNAICFSPDGLSAYWTDTSRRQVFRQRLGRHGWPEGEPELFLDLRAEGHYPDGAVTDAQGHFWNAQWGSARVAEYDAQGRFLRAFELPADHSSCPAFGGPGLTTLYCTSAMQGIPEVRRAAEPGHGCTYAFENAGKGRPEPKVLL